MTPTEPHPIAQVVTSAEIVRARRSLILSMPPRFVRPLAVPRVVPALFGLLGGLLIATNRGHGTKSLRNSGERFSQQKKRRQARRCGRLATSGH